MSRLFLFFVPAVAFAADLKGVSANIIGVINSIMSLIVGLAVFFLVYKVYGYVQSGTDAKKRTEAIQGIIYGAGAIVAMVGVGALIEIGRNILGV